MELTLDAVQWPAMVVTVWAAWFVGSTENRRRKIGFWLFLGSNVLWIVWGVHAQAYALIVLQVCLAAVNIRGACRAKDSTQRSPHRQHCSDKAR